jgi:hypothetical protein
MEEGMTDSLRERVAQYFMEYWGYCGELPIPDAFEHADRIIALLAETSGEDGHAPGCGYFPDESPCTCGLDTALASKKGGG